MAGAFGAAFLLLGTGSVPCLFARLTHLPCPACGSTRAAHALLAGDPEALFRANPLGIAAGALVLAFALHAVHVALRDGTLARVGSGRSGRILLVALTVVAVAEIALWLARFAGFFGGPVPV